MCNKLDGDFIGDEFRVGRVVVYQEALLSNFASAGVRRTVIGDCFGGVIVRSNDEERWNPNPLDRDGEAPFR